VPSGSPTAAIVSLAFFGMLAVGFILSNDVLTH
jgi:hypothetical protein